MQYKWRKKYSNQEARDQIEICRVQIQNNLEELMIADSWTYSPLILALCWQTLEEVKAQAYEQIEYIESKIQYLNQFLCTTK